MQKLKSLKQWIFQHSPGYEAHIEEERTKTSKMMYARSRISFTRVFAPGFHIEAEEYIMDKRLKGGMFRHFRYFGPRGEILFYFFLVLAASRLVRNNLQRENNIEEVLNDTNVFLRIDLSAEDRKIK